MLIVIRVAHAGANTDADADPRPHFGLRMRIEYELHFKINEYLELLQKFLKSKTKISMGNCIYPFSSCQSRIFLLFKAL